MHQLVRRQAKTQPGALHCSICEPGCVRICVLKKKKKKKEFLNLSITHLLILSFQSLISAPFFFCCPALLPSPAFKLGTSCCSAEGDFFFFVSLPEFSSQNLTLCLLVQCRFLFEVILTALLFGPFVLFASYMDLLG